MKRNTKKREQWRFIKARLRDTETKKTKVFSVIHISKTRRKDPKAGVLLEYVNHFYQHEGSQWELDELIFDMIWYSSVVFWEDGKTIDQMYKEW